MQVEPTHTDDNAADLDEVRQKACDEMIALSDALRAETSLSRKSTEPIEVATFEC